LHTFYYADGSIYIGTWKDNLKDGHGIFINADGSSWEADFKADKQLNSDKSTVAARIGPILHVQDILLPSELALGSETTEQAQLILERYINRLKDQYQFYSNLGNNVMDDSFYLTNFQFHQLLKDCDISDGDCTTSTLQIDIC
jgi:hypothetical protein